MLGKTHCLIGIAVGITIAHAYGMGQIEMLASGALGGVVALLPDIDHPNSKISHKLGLFAYPFRIIPHRTFTHALLIPLVFGGIYINNPSWAWVVVAMAWLSHIGADMLTPRGVPILYPLVRKPFALALVRTGGMIENALFLGGLVGLSVLLYEVMTV